MTTAEYAVGTMAAVAFAALLLAIVRSGPGQERADQGHHDRARHGVVTRAPRAEPGAATAERGAATAELAVALPSLVVVLAVALAAVDLGLAQVRCVDAARLGARLLARGEPAATVLAEVRAAAPDGARLSVTTSGGRVTVSSAARCRPPCGRLAGCRRPSASAQALVEGAP